MFQLKPVKLPGYCPDLMLPSFENSDWEMGTDDTDPNEDATGGADEASNEETGVSEARRRDVGTRSRERSRSRDASAMRRR